MGLPAGAEQERVTGLAADAGDPCLSDDDVLAFCEGRLAPERGAMVHQHLDLCSICLQLISGAAHQWASPLVASECATHLNPTQLVLGRYRIVRLIAHGGMGEVYEAVDTSTGKHVALKTVRATVSDSRSARSRLHAEARLARRVRHPNVCRVHEASPSSHGLAMRALPFFTMDLLAGETLRQYLQRQPLSAAEAAALALPLLSGLSAIHRAKVLHLDIKSSNIMLLAGPNGLEPVIVDFGLSQPLERSFAGEPSRLISGSLAYMAPEQLLGQVPGVHSDIFAFGVVLFEMLTQRLPFAVPHSNTHSSLIARLSAPLPRPSSRVNGIPPWLDELVLGCLAEPPRRYPNVEAVAEAVTAGSDARRRARWDDVLRPLPLAV